MNHATSAVPSEPFSARGVLAAAAVTGPVGPVREAGRRYATFAELQQAGRCPASPAAIPLMGRIDFLQHVALHLPDVAARIDEEDFGALHLEMGAMKLATMEAIRRYELHTVRRHFAFISYLYEYADNGLYDAIMVSYLEPLFLGDCPQACDQARSLLPSSLAEALRRAELRNALLRSTWSLSRTFRNPDSISLTLM